MKKYKLLLLSVLLIFLISRLATAMDIIDELRQYPTCIFCGMDRQGNSITRMLVTYDDGTMEGACSIHCLAVVFAAKTGKTIQTIQVADFNKKALIDAETAYWVIGGNMPSVMTKNPKWAFESKSDAEAFISRNSGKLGSFEDAMKASYEEMYSDTMMIREKRKILMKNSNEKKAP